MKILHRFSGATLFESDYLADADLSRADLARYLADAYLARAYLARAYLARADRAARFRERNPQVPFVESLDAKILGVIESGKGKLDMLTWHQCKTTQNPQEASSIIWR